MEEDDLIRIDIPGRVLEIIGVKGRELPSEEVERILAERRKAWKPREAKYKKGVLKIFSRTCGVTHEGRVYGIKTPGTGPDSPEMPVFRKKHGSPFRYMI